MSRILILEDERVVARDLQSILASFGYETSLAASGEEALGVAQRERPDLALVDIRLAGSLDGIETAQALRQQADVPVVYLTAHGDEETLERAAGTEPLGYLVKPFSEPTLRATLQMAVAKAGVERHRRIDDQWRSSVVDQLTVGLITVDSGGKVRMMNARAEALSGWREAEADGRPLADILTLCRDDKSSVTASLLDSVFTGNESAVTEPSLTLVSKSGEEQNVECGLSRVQNEEKQVIGASAVFWPAHFETDSGSGPPRTDEPEWDAVTGLPGRAQAKAAIEAAQKAKTKLFAVLFVLERYYRNSSKFGAAIANEVLTYYGTFLAQEIQQGSFSGGKLFRWTGPSFLALLGPWDSLPIAQREIGRLGRLRLVGEFQFSGRTILLSISAASKIHAIADKAVDKLIGQLDSFLAVQTKIDEVL